MQVTIWGLGSMGSGIARLLRQRGIPISAVWDQDPAKIGQDLAVLLQEPGRADLVVKEPDGQFPEPGGVTIIATGSFLQEVYPQILAAVEAGQHVLTIAEEMAYPWAQYPEEAAALDQAAKAKEVAVLGTGINPGFVLDALIGFLSTASLRVDAIYASRVNDLAPFGPTVLRTQGVGTTPEQFRAGMTDGSIVGHIGFPESIHMIAAMLGWTIDRIEQERDPIVSKTRRSTPFVTVEPGQVAGCNHRASGYCGEKAVITLEHPQQICPESEGTVTGDHIRLHGEPSITMNIGPEIPGGLGTIAVAVNCLPRLLEATPGLRTMLDLTLPSCGRWSNVIRR